MLGSRLGSKVALYGSKVGSVADDEGSDKTLVMFFGQSNAQMRGPTSALSLRNLSYADAYPSVQMMAHQGDIADPPVVTTTPLQSLDSVTFLGGDCIGVMHSCMRDLDRILPSRLACGVFAHGGSSSVYWLPSNPFPTIPPYLFDQFITYTKSCMASMGCGRVVFVYLQGESNTNTAPLSAEWEADTGTILNAIRSYFPGAPFVFGRVPTEYNGEGGGGAFSSAVRAQQDAFLAEGRPGVTMVTPDAITFASGEYLKPHYSADGYADLGHIFSPVIARTFGLRVLPTASFTYTPTALSVAFTDTSVSYGDTITSWLWTFGDGNTSTAQSPTHVYSASGTYNVTLKVTNASGDSDTSIAKAVSVISGIAGVSRDALSAKYVPANLTEWGTLITAIGSTMVAPDGLWLSQELSGNLLDSIGSIPLVPANAPGYNMPQAGWVRKWCGYDGGTSGLFVQRFSSSAVGLPDISTTSVLTLAYVAFPSSAPTTSRSVLAHGPNATRTASEVLLTSGKAQDRSVGNVSSSSTLSICDGLVHPVVKLFDRTNTRDVTYTDSDKLVAAFAATASGNTMTLGAVSGGSNNIAGGYLYVASWYGTHAQVTDAQIKTLLQGLGWTIPWT